MKKIKFLLICFVSLLLLVLAAVYHFNTQNLFLTDTAIHPQENYLSETMEQLFSPEELEWLELHQDRPFIVGFSKEYIPLEYVRDNKVEGIGINLLQDVSSITGLTFELYEPSLIKPWQGLLSDFKEGHIDILPTVSKSEARQEFMLFSDAYIDTTLIVLGKSEIFRFYEDFNDFNDSDNITFAIPKGFWLDDIIAKNHANIKIHHVKSIESAFEAISSNQADYVICEMPLYYYYKNEGSIDDLNVVGEMLTKNPVHIGLQKELMPLQGIINKTIRYLDGSFIHSYASLEEKKYNEEVMAFVISLLVLLVFLAMAYILHLLKQLKSDKDSLVSWDDERKKLLADLTHDLKTPVAVINGYANAFIDGQVRSDEDLFRYMHRIADKSDQLNILINDMLFLSKLNKGQIPFKKEAFFLNESLSQYMNTMELTFKEKNINMKLDLDPEIKKYIIGDKGKLLRCVENLVSNGLHYSSSGDALTLRTKKINDRIQIHVADTGPGISPEDLPRVFDRYYRGYTKEKSLRSSGLGLCIVKEIITEHKGRIWVESELNKGTTFFIEL